MLILKQLHLKLSSSRNSWQVMLRIFNHPEKVTETAWHPQLQINLGHYKCKAMDFLTFLIWYLLVYLAGGQSGMISNKKKVKSLTFASTFCIIEYLKMQNIFARKELIYILKSSRHLKSNCKHYKHCQGFHTIICLPRT